MDLATRGWDHGADAFLVGIVRLRAHGVRLARYEQWLAISHPLLSGGRLLWTPGSGGQWAVEVQGQYLVEDISERRGGGNPLYRDQRRPLAEAWWVDRLSPGLLQRARDPAVLLEAPLDASELGRPGALLCGVDFGGPQRAVLLFVPEDPAGFTADEQRRIHTFAWAMASVGRAHRWRALSAVLARTYIGPQTGLRVLGGQLRRGDLERRHAVVWFSDVRGFTELSTRATPEQVVEVLNGVFEALGREISRGGGEILKFIGDAVLAIFPYAEEAGAADAVGRALEAARAGLARLPEGVRVGIGLHRGELAYGNIGASDRLDFTVIGTTVNTASRIEGMTGKLGMPLLCSADVAACAPRSWTRVGAFELKGLSGETELFAPAEPSEG
jgi:adenylate cyclase